VILVADRCTPCRGYELLAHGAHGCIDTRTTAEELRRAIRTAARGQTYLGSTIQAAVAAEIRLRGKAERPFLRPRELEVLEHIARGESLTGIAAQLHLAPTTVKTHAANLYGKLGVGDRAAAVAEGMRRQLID
jgi:two-component system nitrate/nitrite response regulator NarL